MLGQGSATAADVLAALDGAWLAHIAAHGTFRADNPMFSSILLDDGPLTVHDFERLGRTPYRLVLSSCDSGVVATVGTDESWAGEQPGPARRGRNRGQYRARQ